MICRINIRHTLILLTTLLSTCETALCDNSYLIRYKFEPDKQLRYRSTQTIAQSAATPAGNKLDVSKVVQTRVFKVQEVAENGEAKVSMQFEHVRMEMKSNDQPAQVFDSTMAANEVPDIFRSAAARLKGAAARYTLFPSGTPVSEDGIEQVTADSQASFMMPLPVDAISVGESWKVNMIVKARMAEGIKRDIKLLRTFRLKSVKDNIATITFATSIASKVTTPKVKGQLLQATPAGTITFDLDRGTVIKRVLTFDRAVLGVLGKNTLLSATGRIEETLLEQNEAKVTSR